MVFIWRLNLPANRSSRQQQESSRIVGRIVPGRSQKGVGDKFKLPLARLNFPKTARNTRYAGEPETNLFIPSFHFRSRVEAILDGGARISLLGIMFLATGLLGYTKNCHRTRGNSRNPIVFSLFTSNFHILRSMPLQQFWLPKLLQRFPLALTISDCAGLLHES